MNTRAVSFGYKMRHDLRYRLMTAFLVCFLPICIVGCVLVGVLWNRTQREIHASNQAQLEAAMSYWERDSHTVDRAMEYFVSIHISELNYDNLSWSDMTRYDMFSQLEQILPEADHNGIVSLYDIQADRVLTQMRDPGVDAKTMDSQVQEFTRRVRNDDMPDRSWQEIDGRYYLIKRFDYRNGRIFVAMDVGNSIVERLAPLRKERTEVYVADAEKIITLTDSGPIETDLTWEQCTASRLGHTSLYWRSGSFPIAVCLVNEASVLSLLPWEYWVLLLVVLSSIRIALGLPRLIRLEVLDPGEKLRNAMHQIQTDHLDFRLEDNYYRNSDDIQYLFDTFDEMADEIEASREKDKKMYQAEMDNLRLQVNPHMLLNSLNTIYSLAQMKKFEAIQEYALHLVDYFRYALRRNDNLVTVEQELEFIKTYIEIQKIRYPGFLSFVYSIADDCMTAKVPPLLIQNFIENSVKYAVKPGKVTEILLNVHRHEERMEISVTDTGTGVKPEVLEHLRIGEAYVDAMGQKHIGIWNCRRRIEVFYNETPRIEITSGQGGTQVFLDIPFWTEDAK